MYRENSRENPKLLAQLPGTATLRQPSFEEFLAADDRVFERGLSRVLDQLISLLEGRFAVVVQKIARGRRQYVGRWANASTIGRADKLLRTRQASRILRAPPGRWVCEEASSGPEAIHERAGFRVPTSPDVTLALIVGWTRLPAWLVAPRADRDARGLANLVSAAWFLDHLKEENNSLRLSLEDARRKVPPSGPVRREFSPGIAFPPTSFEELQSRFPEIVGASDATCQLLESIARAARSDLTVLVAGESGTGKELVARAIHLGSRRAGAQFAWENCGAIAEHLVESELFGHEEGAFTGASQSKAGLFERAQGGTVFLDEIGEMALPMQKRLLRVLQEKEIRRVGGQETIQADFRVISATHRNLEELVLTGGFREDLFYRLNVILITILPLRERLVDITTLIDYFNDRFSREAQRAPLSFTRETLNLLTSYSWPGNARELRNEILRLVASDSRTIRPEALSARIATNNWSTNLEAGVPSRRLGDIERQVLGKAVVDALRRAKGNISRAAAELGLTRQSLYRRLKRYGLVRTGDSEDAPGR